jgi:glycosyltransferase involved in cell wall biosynthesis
METARSVAAQDYPNIEYLVIDGGSNDGFNVALQDLHHLVDFYISEPDLGIYDAMNKGIKNATGDWIIFLNAGDCFFETYSLRHAMEQPALHGNNDIIIGATEFVFTSGYRKITRPKNIDLKWGMRFCHQSTFVRMDYHIDNLFDLSDGIAADYGFFVRAIRKNAAIETIEQVISTFHADGISSLDHSANIKRESELYMKYNKTSSYSFLLRRIYSKMAGVAKSILPSSAIDIIRGLK